MLRCNDNDVAAGKPVCRILRFPGLCLVRSAGRKPVVQLWGLKMRKGALLLALVMVAAAPTAALAAKAKAPVDPNANTKKLMYTLSMQPVYVMQNNFGFNPKKK